MIRLTLLLLLNVCEIEQIFALTSCLRFSGLSFFLHFIFFNIGTAAVLVLNLGRIRPGAPSMRLVDAAKLALSTRLWIEFIVIITLVCKGLWSHRLALLPDFLEIFAEALVLLQIRIGDQHVIPFKLFPLFSCAQLLCGGF